ncbi:hypothetical protein Tco_1308543, partial [Tanacetum coccineum]
LLVDRTVIRSSCVKVKSFGLEITRDFTILVETEKIDLEERLEETRRARSILLLMHGFTPTDLWDDNAKRCDEEFRRSMKEEKARRASNTCTSCEYLNWDCWCKMDYEERRAALKGKSPVKTQQKISLLMSS